MPTPEHPTHEMHDEARKPSNSRPIHLWLSMLVLAIAAIAVGVAVLAY